jgi:AcrR family transcriptional regulator
MSMPETMTTKERIFFAAMSVFAREGFKGATVREICSRAGTANATAVNYYFGSKEKLYEAILDMIFAENMRRHGAEAGAETDPDATPEERLRAFLTTLIEVGFGEGEVAEDARAIVLREMTSPSRHLDQMVEAYSRTENTVMDGILRDILGPDAPEELVRDCLASVAGQVFYYLAFWPVFSRVYPDHPGVNAYREQLVDHIVRFSMAGLRATREALD